jgi:hypothetical protein
MAFVKSAKSGTYFNIGFQENVVIEISDMLAEKLVKKYNFICIVGKPLDKIVEEQVKVIEELEEKEEVKEEIIVEEKPKAKVVKSFFKKSVKKK